MNEVITVTTSKGVMRAEASNDSLYPGIKVYMNNILVGAVELYESDELLRCRLYDEDSCEPIVLTTLIDFNEEVNSIEEC